MLEKQIALIPVLEPDHHLLEILRPLKSTGWDIVVVDDGSGTHYQHVFQQADRFATVLHHKTNRGKGAALKTGLHYIQRKYAGAVVVTLDADGQHTVRDAETVCNAAMKNPGCLVLGCRGQSRGTPLRSKVGHAVTRFVYSHATGSTVYDTQSGLRAFDSSLSPMFASIEGERYEYEMNVLLECARRHIPVLEVPIETIYLNKNRASHFHPVWDSFRIYRELLKFSAASILCFLLDYGLYCLFISFTAGLGGAAGIWVANAGARLLSAGVNYTINRKFVFQSTNRLIPSALRYALLATAVLLANTLFLSLLAEGLSLNRYAAKLLTEVLFFFISWLVQRRFVFSKDM